MMEVQTWSLKTPNGKKTDDVLDCIANLLKRQKGKQVTIQKIAKHIKSEMEIKAKHADLVKLMIQYGAMSVDSSQRNTYIFDITSCVLKNRRAKKGRSHSRIE